MVGVTPESFDARTRDGWRLWAAPAWLGRLDAVLREVERESGWLHGSKHARTKPLRLPGVPGAYLKSYRRYGWVSAVKDALRPSKALRALEASEALSRHGFPTPAVLAVGERRQLGVLMAAFLVTAEIDAGDLRVVLERSSRERKRSLLAELGRHVGRLHDEGFYHGDLVPPNVRVEENEGEFRIVLLDNDRTRLGRRPVPLRQARRNLVQLNRFPVRGVSVTDRWRVVRSYVQTRGIERDRARALIRWVVSKTAERRREFDGIEGAERMSFRALMSASRD